MTERNWNNWWNNLTESQKQEIRKEIRSIAENIDGLHSGVATEGSIRMALSNRLYRQPYEKKGESTLYYPNHPLFYIHMTLAIYYSKLYQLTGEKTNLATNLSWHKLPEEIKGIAEDICPLVANDETENWNYRIVQHNALYETAQIINGWMRDRKASEFTSIAGMIEVDQNYVYNLDPDGGFSSEETFDGYPAGGAGGGRDNEFGGYEGGYGPIRLDLEYEERLAKARSRTQDVSIPTPGHEWQIKKDGKWVDAHLINPHDVEDTDTVIGLILEEEEITLDNLSFTTNNPYLVETIRAPWPEEGIPNDLFCKFYLNPGAAVKLVNRYNKGEDKLVRRKRLAYSSEDEFQRMFKPPEELLLDSIRDVIHGIKTPDGWYNRENMSPTPHTAHVKITEEELLFNGLSFDAQYLKDWIAPTDRSMDYFYDAWDKLQITEHGAKAIHWMDAITGPVGPAGVAEGITHAAFKTRFSFEGLTGMDNSEIIRPLQFLSIPELEALRIDILNLWGDLQRERNIASIVDFISALPVAGTVANQAYKMIRRRIGSGEWVDWSDSRFVIDLIKDVLGVLGESSVKSILKSALKPLSLAKTIAQAESRHITHKACSGYLSGLLTEIDTQIEASTAENEIEFETNQRIIPRELKWALWREVEFAARVWRRYHELAESRIENVSIGFTETEKGYIRNLYQDYTNISDFNKVMVVNQLFLGPYGGRYAEGSPYTVESDGENRLVGIREYDHYTYMDQVLLPFVGKQIRDLQKFTFIDYMEQSHYITQFEGLMLHAGTPSQTTTEDTLDETSLLFRGMPRVTQGIEYGDDGPTESANTEDWSLTGSIPVIYDELDPGIEGYGKYHFDNATDLGYAESKGGLDFCEGGNSAGGSVDNRTQMPSLEYFAFRREPMAGETSAIMDIYSSGPSKDIITGLDAPVVAPPSTPMNRSQVIPVSTGLKPQVNATGRGVASDVRQNVNKIVRMVINRYETVNERKIREEIVNLMRKNNTRIA
ncbi:hypothetical protein GF359_05040 [candidate division WOR-3 bacterium]|uniref:Uncharacterized protein n=1 Tax=candidate division WOR-3 bacterium TaxID=2052148 RepID=A0A9D5K8Z1_UNCW3|nr:hypothetical protein [candidate division WOR-3 bacterium]MBD3364561.1 hypothetical protein [candidate division WOR-3 bacterium]